MYFHKDDDAIMGVMNIGWYLKTFTLKQKKIIEVKNQHLRTKFEMRLSNDEGWYQS